MTTRLRRRDRRHRRARGWFALSIAGAMLAGLLAHPRAAAADSVVFRGTTIPLRNCTILEIASGRLHFRNAAGRRMLRELDEITSIEFDDLPALTEANRLEAAGDRAAATRALLQALVATDDAVRTLWVRSRLARLHDAQGEYVQAAAHAAEVFAMRDETYWRGLEPMARPNGDARFTCTFEAITALRAARRTVRQPVLRQALTRMLESIEPIHARRRETWKGAVPEPGSTRSGWSVDQIRAGRFDGTRSAAIDGGEASPSDGRERARPRTSPRVDDPPRPRAGRDRAPQDPSGAWSFDSPAMSRRTSAPLDAPQAIQMLLDERRFDEALKRCERVARAPGDRSLARFLEQYGASLAGAGRPRDAAIMFMRCAILYESSSSAPRCLLEAAKIHRDIYKDDRMTRRLLGRAIAVAEAQGRDDARRRAAEMLDALGPERRE